MTMWAPNCLAASRRAAARSTATMWRGAEEPRGDDRGEPDRARTDDDDGVAGADPAVEDPDLVCGGQDVGEHQRGLVGDGVRERAGERSANGHPDEFRLHAVDEVAEDPAAAAEALPVAPSRQ